MDVRDASGCLMGHAIRDGRRKSLAGICESADSLCLPRIGQAEGVTEIDVDAIPVSGQAQGGCRWHILLQRVYLAEARCMLLTRQVRLPLSVAFWEARSDGLWDKLLGAVL